MGDKDKRHSFFGDMIKYGILLAIVGGIAWYFLADKFRKTKGVQNVVTNFELAEVDKDLQPTLEKRLNPTKGIAAAGTAAYYWRVYFKHLSEEEVTDPKYKLYVDAQYKHDINKSKRSDGNGTSKHYTPGKLVFQIRVKQKRGLTKTLYKHRYEKEIRAIVLQHAGEGISGERKKKAFNDAESFFVKYELGPQLTLAAIGLIANTKKLDDAYTPVLIDGVLSSHKGVSGSALETLKGFRPKDATQIQVALDDLNKRGPNAKEKHTQDNCNAAREFLQKCLKKAKPKEKSPSDDAEGKKK